MWIIKRFLFALLGLLILAPQGTFAISNYDLNAINRYTPFYDVDGFSGICEGGGATITGDNVKDAFIYFTGQLGLTDYQAAGIIGNLMQESGGGLDPKAQQDGSNDPYPKDGVGFGIAQWTYSSRQVPLIELAKKLGKPPTDLGVQLQYVGQELHTTYKSALHALLISTNVRDATIAIAKYYEGCADCAGIGTPGNSENVRLTNAQHVLDLAKKLGWAGSSGGGSASSCDTSSAAGSKIVAIALAEVGTNEGGTDNAGPSCKYQGSACPPGEMWCADFASWVYKQAGVPFTEGADGGWRQASSCGLKDWFKKNEIWFNNPGKPMPQDDPKAPQPGDVVIYCNGSEGHTQIVVSYDGKTVKTVGGNQSDSVSTTPYDVFGTAAGWGRLK
jgi:hypothetical protein